jgi:parallel beta-helix repeat protein
MEGESGAATAKPAPTEVLMRAILLSLAGSFTLLSLACATDDEPTGPVSGDLRPAMSVSAAIACGDQVTTDLTVQNDLTCAGDALFVMADGISINLNGHTIAGDGTGIGITLRGRTDVTIKGGTVRNFITGIFVNTSTGVVIKDNGFTQNREGVFFAGSSGNVVKANVAWQNTQRGFMVRPAGTVVVSTDNDFVGNVLTDNPSGILVFGQPGNTFKGNTISGSTVGAFDLTGGGATGNLFKENLLTGSAAGIKFGPGYTGNSFIGNSLVSNTCALQGTSAGNTFQGNVFSGNGSNSCP